MVHHGRLVAYEQEDNRMQHALMREGVVQQTHASCESVKKKHDRE